MTAYPFNSLVWISIIPSGLLYLIAFSTIFEKTSVRPSLSPFIYTSLQVLIILTPLLTAFGSTSLTTSSIISFMLTLAGLRLIALLSNLDMVSIWLIILHILFTDALIFLRTSL